MTKFIVTVDTETFRIGREAVPFETHLYGKLTAGTYGIDRIMDVCDRHGVSATFFVDVYMHHEYGNQKVAELCRHIAGRGHDVQLHAHTSWLPGSHSGLICRHPLEKQIQIIEEGKQFMQECTGEAPVAFRAGAYGANLDTIRALKENGFLLDSSYFPFYPTCELSRELNHRCTNLPFAIKGITEIPVTTYWLVHTSLYRKNSKIDVNACSWSELEDIVPKLTGTGIPYGVLFLHSFSFIKLDRALHGSPDPKPLERFEKLLELLREDRDAGFVTMKSIAKTGGCDPREQDQIPTLAPARIVSRAARRLVG